MPGHDFVELMRIQIRDGKSLLEFSGGKTFTQVLTETGDAMRTVAVVPIEIIRNETVHALRDAEADPVLQHLAPMRIVQTRPIFAHPADVVTIVRNRLSEAVLLDQIKRVQDGSGAEQFFIPLIAIESEEAAWPFWTVRIAYEKFYIQMTDHFDATTMQLRVEPGEPFGAFTLAAHWKM